MALTIRQTLARLLEQKDYTARQLADALDLTPREVEDHLVHLRRSQGRRLIMEPARCRGCGYRFKGRTRLDAPGRCPRCRGQRIEGPYFGLRN